MAKKKTTSSRSTSKHSSVKSDNATTQARSRRSTAPAIEEMQVEEDSIESESPRKASRSMSGTRNKNVWQDLISNPAVRYVAGGIATAVLTKIASNFSTNYPEISRFITENLDGVEGRLGEFKNSLNNDSQVSRH